MLTARALAPFHDVFILKPKIHADPRGFFLESFNARTFEAVTGCSPTFVQDNHSRSCKGVLRGIHYQRPPHAQGKLVRVVNGAVFDVVVDLRRSSPTFGQWAGIILTDTGGEILWIPPGFGHAFLVLKDNTDFLYKTTDFYAPESEGAVAWNDPAIAIAWPKEFTPSTLLLSEKDKAAPLLSHAQVFD